VSPALLLGALATALLAAILLGVTTGAYSIRAADIPRILLQAGDTDAEQSAVLLGIRLPRVALALVTGAGLAVCGAALQGLFRNPLADPTLVGVSSGAALGAAAMIVMGAVWFPGLTRSAYGQFAVPLAAFAGALAAVAVVYRLATRGGRSDMAMMLLAGIAVAAIAEALIGYFTYLSNDEQLRNLTFWRLGSLGAAKWSVVALIAPVVSVALCVFARLAPALNALLLGEAEAQHLGVDIQGLKRWVILFTALTVGVLVSATGMIVFVGILVPHLVRLAAGPDHRLLFAASAMLGATLMIGADIVARTAVAPAELPIGVLTALMGAPFFLWLLRRRNLWRW
jgi:iron complex transport system permease protein